LVPVLLVGGGVGLYYAAVGSPRNPMTTARADVLFGGGVQPRQSRRQVETWLASQGILPAASFRPEVVSYNLLRRREDEILKGWWMDCNGNQTVAECAGLDVDKVYSFIRVTYPDSARFLFGQAEVRVYLFFDAEDRLIRHWSDQFIYCP
jgi:hypothetical protein